jgi:Flp pilus assembly protein TadD
MNLSRLSLALGLLTLLFAPNAIAQIQPPNEQDLRLVPRPTTPVARKVYDSGNRAVTRSEFLEALYEAIQQDVRALPNAKGASTGEPKTVAEAFRQKGIAIPAEFTGSGNLTRGAMALGLLRLLTPYLSKIPEVNSGFSAASGAAPANVLSAVNSLGRRGLNLLYTDGTFQADRPVNTFELVEITNRLKPIFARATLQEIAQIPVTADIESGTLLESRRTIRVIPKVTSDDPENPRFVTAVELYVNGELRETDKSTPFTFDIDPAGEPDGELKLRFQVYDSEGGQGVLELTLMINNRKGEGASFHINAAKKAIAEKNFTAAIESLRIAQQIEPDSAEIKTLQARANLGAGNLELAQKFAEDGLKASPGNVELTRLLVESAGRRAFAIANRGGDEGETNRAIGQALSTTINAQKSLLERQFEELGGPTDENLLQYIDLASQLGRYSLAINAAQPAFSKNPQNTRIANRLLYNQLRAFRIEDARKLVDEIRRFGKPDATTYSLIGVMEAMRSQDTASDQAIREALILDATEPTVNAAQAFIALIRDNRAALGSVLSSLEKAEGEEAVQGYYQMALNSALGNFDRSLAGFQQGVLNDPLLYDLYIERANEILIPVIAGRFTEEGRRLAVAVARIYLDLALSVKPDSAEALTGQSLLLLAEGKNAEAIRMAQAATRAGEGYAPAWLTLSALLRLDPATLSEAGAPLRRAIELDRARLGGYTSATADLAWVYWARYGRAPVLARPY